MAKRKRRTTRSNSGGAVDVLQMGLLLGMLLLIGSLISEAQQHPQAIGYGLFFLFILALIWISRRSGGRRRFRRHFEAMLNKHENALLTYYRQSVHEDAFGNRIDAKWQRHIDTFLRTQILDESVQFPAWRKSEQGQKLAREVDEFARRALKESPTLAAVSVMDLSPNDYERHCADSLRKRGWKVQVTQASRDGGADFVAEKREHRIVAQCKRLAKPAGNSAVQQAHSAVRLYSGTVACVVAPHGFTAQARSEAFALNVHLVDHDKLQDFADRVEGGRLV